jgi:hypothetical protein
MEEHTGKWRTDAGDQTRAWSSGGTVVASNPLDIKLKLHPPIFRFPTPFSLDPLLCVADLQGMEASPHDLVFSLCRYDASHKPICLVVVDGQ